MSAPAAAPSPSTSATADLPAAKITELEAELKELKGKISALEGKITALEGKIAEAEAAHDAPAAALLREERQEFKNERLEAKEDAKQLRNMLLALQQEKNLLLQAQQQAPKSSANGQCKRSIETLIVSRVDWTLIDIPLSLSLSPVTEAIIMVQLYNRPSVSASGVASSPLGVPVRTQVNYDALLTQVISAHSSLSSVPRTALQLYYFPVLHSVDCRVKVDSDADLRLFLAERPSLPERCRCLFVHVRPPPSVLGGKGASPSKVPAIWTELANKEKQQELSRVQSPLSAHYLSPNSAGEPPSGRSTELQREMRKLVLNRDYDEEAGKHYCAFCRSAHDESLLECAHIVPVGGLLGLLPPNTGGRYNIANGVPACDACHKLFDVSAKLWCHVNGNRVELQLLLGEDGKLDASLAKDDHAVALYKGIEKDTLLFYPPKARERNPMFRPMPEWWTWREKWAAEKRASHPCSNCHKTPAPSRCQNPKGKMCSVCCRYNGGCPSYRHQPQPAVVSPPHSPTPTAAASSVAASASAAAAAAKDKSMPGVGGGPDAASALSASANITQLASKFGTLTTSTPRPKCPLCFLRNLNMGCTSAKGRLCAQCCKAEGQHVCPLHAKM
jgi:hypothetical protein